MNILFFDQPGADEAAIYGGKAASLGRLAATAQVPPGFSIPADAYRSWLESDAREIPDAIAVEIRHAYAALEVKSDTKKVAVAVRSSAIDEDGAGDSFAGLHDTYLNIRGIDAVIESVVDCWRSLRNQRAMEYRESRGFDASSAAMGVVVQQLVNTDVSAVAFSANPITGNPDEIVINANYGLGEAVVSGITTPDTVVVRKFDHGQQSLSLGAKEVMTVRTDAGTNERDTPRILRDQPALSREQATAIADLALLLEDHHGWPVDVECAIQDSNIFLLQCRPITTLPADLPFQRDSTPAGSNALGAEDQEVSHRRRESQPIPVPDDFQFEWDDPADAKLTFTHDSAFRLDQETLLGCWRVRGI